MENKKRKQYLFDSSVKISPRTYYRNISKTKKARFAPQIDIEPLGIPTIQDNIESIDIQSNIIQSIDDQTSVNRSSENQSSDNQFGDIQDNFSFFQELNEVFQNETVTKEDLAAGYLTAFYNGRDSQKSLSNYLCLSNIGSSIKLPCNYNGLKSFLNKNKKKVNFEKTWYCGVCQKYAPFQPYASGQLCQNYYTHAEYEQQKFSSPQYIQQHNSILTTPTIQKVKHASTLLSTSQAPVSQAKNRYDNTESMDLEDETLDCPYE